MTKSEYIRARVEPDLKSDVEMIFQTLGLNSSEAINLFYRQVQLHRGLPFDIKIPNSETIKALEDTRKKRNLVQCNNIDDLFESLEI